MSDMEEHEEKGFVVKDRRKVSLDDVDQKAAPDQIQEETEAAPEEKLRDSPRLLIARR